MRSAASPRAEDLDVCLAFSRPATKLTVDAGFQGRRHNARERGAARDAKTRKKAQRPSLPVDSTLPRLLTTAEVATLFRTSPSSMRDWRDKDYGPAWLKVGKNVVYRESVVLAWMERQERPAKAQASSRRTA